MYIVKTKEERVTYFQKAIIDLAIDEIEKTKHALDKKDRQIIDMKKSQKEAAREAVLGIINEMTPEQLEIMVQKKKENSKDR